MFDFIEVKLIGVTMPVVDYIPDSQGIISHAARVSNPENQNNYETAGGLLNYCVREQHWSVFEMANAVVEIKAPRDIARQILRHGSNKFQEFSQRYAEATDFVVREARLQDTKNRQNSIKVDNESLQKEWADRQNEVLALVKENYEWALKNGIAKECARVILPEGNTMSTMYMNGTIRSFFHYANLRDGNGTQLEHIDVAKKVKKEILKHYPFLEKVWEGK